MHRFADEVLAQHGPKRGASIAIARERRESRALELDVAEHAVAPFAFSEQNGAPVTELRHEAAELMSRVGHRDGICIVRQLISGEECRRLALDDVRVQSKLLGQRSD